MLPAGVNVEKRYAVVCPVHKILHTPDMSNSVHQGCESHGHCLNPIQCTETDFCHIQAQIKKEQLFAMYEKFLKS